MISLSQAQTVDIKQCRICSGHLLSPDSFCRWCGVCQNEEQAVIANVVATQKVSLNRQGTKALRNHEDVHQSISKLLLKTMAENVEMKTGSLQLNRFGVFVIASVIAIPMWLLIVLMSPLDAYALAKAASSRMSNH